MEKKWYKSDLVISILILFALLGIALSACSPAQATPPVEAAQAGDPVEATAEEKAPRNELEASDPGLVNLASSQVQLVEFFAFW